MRSFFLVSSIVGVRALAIKHVFPGVNLKEADGNADRLDVMIKELINERDKLDRYKERTEVQESQVTSEGNGGDDNNDIETKIEKAIRAKKPGEVVSFDLHATVHTEAHVNDDANGTDDAMKKIKQAIASFEKSGQIASFKFGATVRREITEGGNLSDVANLLAWMRLRMQELPAEIETLNKEIEKLGDEEPAATTKKEKSTTAFHRNKELVELNANYPKLNTLSQSGSADADLRILLAAKVMQVLLRSRSQKATEENIAQIWKDFREVPEATLDSVYKNMRQDCGDGMPVQGSGETHRKYLEACKQKREKETSEN